MEDRVRVAGAVHVDQATAALLALALVAVVGLRLFQVLLLSEVVQCLAHRAGLVDLERDVFVGLDSGGAVVALQALDA